MFNPYAESLSSTGEPPTSDGESDVIAPAVVVNEQETTSNLSLSNNSSRSLSVQEPDSGYEASPSSVADNQRFFGEQSANRSAEMPSNSDEELNVVEGEFLLFSDSESDELDDYDTCLDCSSSPVSCSCCCYRTDSSTTTTHANCDNSRCNSSELSMHRPSSNPIQIPNLPPCRIRSSDAGPRIVVGSPVDLCPLPRSQPIDFSPRQRLTLMGLPLSWPSTASSPVRNCRNFALSPSRSNPTNRDIPNATNYRRYNHPVRSRRQIIDSEASSYGSSDEEGPEDVFNVPSGEASSHSTMMTVSSVPLPDVVLESTDSGRRSRSMSINLPPNRDHVITDIGRRLRRLSDIFEQRQYRMAFERARGRTLSDCGDLQRNGFS